MLFDSLVVGAALCQNGGAVHITVSRLDDGDGSRRTTGTASQRGGKRHDSQNTHLCDCLPQTLGDSPSTGRREQEELPETVSRNAAEGCIDPAPDRAIGGADAIDLRSGFPL